MKILKRIDKKEFLTNLGDFIVDVRNKLPPKVIQEDGTYVIKVGKAKRHCTQSELADWLLVTFQQVQKYEKAVNEFSLTRFVGMCDYLGLDYTTVIKIAKEGFEKGKLDEKLQNLAKYETINIEDNK